MTTQTEFHHALCKHQQAVQALQKIAYNLSDGISVGIALNMTVPENFAAGLLELACRDLFLATDELINAAGRQNDVTPLPQEQISILCDLQNLVSHIIPDLPYLKNIKLLIEPIYQYSLQLSDYA